MAAVPAETPLPSPESAIAIVGLAVRMPGAPHLEAFWHNLANGIESVTFFDHDELITAGVDPALLANPRYVKAKPMLTAVDLFDATAFGMSAREAELTDPQHRIFLELCLEALERAGCAPEQFRGSIGLFAGAGLSAYLLHNLAGSSDEPLHFGGAHLGIGNIQDFLTTRVAYKLNLKGPAYSVQSACSTSLVAVHLACQTLLGYECDMALAGGVSVSLPVKTGYLYQEEGMLSPDGHCRPFDAAARGTIFGNGAGVVVLKRFADAVRDGDTIYAVVLGSAVNNDGALKAGFTAPSVLGQAAVISEALSNAGVDATDIGYVETHGTATVLGDPIEIEGLTRAFREHTGANQFCAIGSVKSNIGHLDTAAGIAGFAKTVLSLYRGAIPPSLNFESPNPRIDFGSSPFFVNTTLRTWDATRSRRAGVSAFGVGGTNAHVVLGAAPRAGVSGPSRTWHVLPVSARTEAALTRVTTDLADFLDDHPETPLADAAYTLQIGRRAGEFRRVTVVQDTDEAIDRLLGLPPQEVFTSTRRGAGRPVVFMFPGQGAQYAGMAAELYREEPVLRRELDSCCAALKNAGASLDVLPLITSTDADPACLRHADAEHLSLFAFEYALGRLWMSWGVEPEMMIGHSIGEYVAATLAGVWTLHTAATLVATRASMMSRLPAGAMLAVPIPPDEVRPLLDESVALALVNARATVVVSGTVDGIATVESRLRARGIATRRLDTACAYHSPLVDACLPAFEAVCARAQLTPPRIPLVSGATGRVVTREEAVDPRFWARQIRNPVYFGEGIRELLKDPERVMLEVGPGLTLNALARQNADPGTSPTLLASLPDARERRSEARGLMTALARVWLAGVNVDWNAVHAGETRRRLPLPTYPFERQRFWIEPRTRANGAAPSSPERLPEIADWFALPAWTRRPVPVRPDPAPPARTLLFLGNDALSAALRDTFAGDVICVQPGGRFERCHDGSYRVGPAAEDYAQFVSSLAGADTMPGQVVHAWTVEAPDDLDRGFFSLLWLGRELGARATSTIRLAIVTPGIHAVIGNECLAPLAATVLGPGIVLGQEFPQLACHAIDVQPQHDDPVTLARRIRDEIAAAPHDRVVALRGSHRWVRSMDKASLPASTRARLKPRGVYLITGGTGGMGLTLAEFLAGEFQARLMLVARTALPTRETWPHWRTTADSDPTGNRVRAIERLEAAGSEVLVTAADVTSDADMQRAVAMALERWGRIDGVIHAAGIAGGGLAVLKNRAMAEAVLAPKVTGPLALERALGEAPLDFFVACSSLASLAGGVGQVDYCAANAFLDSWAGARAASGRPVISINWDAWREVGMAVNAAMPAEGREMRESQLALAIVPAEGVEVFRRVLDRDYPQVAVCTVGVGERLRAVTAVRGQSADRPAPRHPRPTLSTDYVDPATDLERRLAGVWSGVLGIDTVGALDNFFELGGDSLTALRAIDVLKEAHGVELAVAAFYAAPTIRLLAAQIETV